MRCQYNSNYVKLEILDIRSVESSISNNNNNSCDNNKKQMNRWNDTNSALNIIF